MPQTIPIEFFIGSVSVIGALTGYVWNGLHRRLEVIEQEQRACPFPDIRSDIAALRKDIQWIKSIMMKIN